MIVRKATHDDALDILSWRNDPQTRALSRNQDEVERAPHLEWFGKALVDPRLTLLIGEVDGVKIGMVRFDHGDETEVSINVNPACRSRGHGYALLAEAMKHVAGDVWAEIKDENLASQRVFERAGFEHQGVRGGLRRYLRRGV